MENNQDLSRELDRVFAKVFSGANSAFLGSLICSMNVVWSNEIETACTNGETIKWNPEFFKRCSENLRVFTLVHELWHPGRLHFLRRGNRDPELWNIAADHEINLAMVEDGFNADGFPMYADKRFKGMAAEQIYDILQQENQTANPNIPQDMEEPPDEPEDKEKAEQIRNTVVQNVMRAVHAATQANQAGKLPGAITETLKAYMKPVVPWETVLHQFMEDLLEEDFTWERPDRRHEEFYLPSMFTDEGQLQRLNYYFDVSGSVNRKQVERFNSEVAFIKDRYNPAELCLVQFDTRIQKETLITDRQQFDELEIHGRGGTCLECVRQHIDEQKPTAAIIFTDLYCEPMAPLQHNIPVIWIVIGHRGAPVPFGKVIYIDE